MELTRKIDASVGAAAVSIGLSVPPAGAASCPDNGWWVRVGTFLVVDAADSNGAC